MSIIAIIDLKLGNISSVCNALNFLGFEYVLAEEIKHIRQSDKIIFPGVGSFKVASERLSANNFIECIREECLTKNKPILGICLGMQLLAKTGEEGGHSLGLGLIDATVEKLSINTKQFKLPHIGWNDVFNKDIKILNNIGGSCFYFVHSYHMILNEKCNFATTNYGIDFVSAVQKGNILGVQFHPEKSRDAGLELIKKFITDEF